MHLRRSARIIVLILVLTAIFGSGAALADARIGTDLAAQLLNALPLQQLEIVVTYKQSGPLQAAQVQALKALGINRGLTFQSLPIAGGLATPGAIRNLARRSDVLSIHSNRTLSYFNNEARELSGVNALQADPNYG